MLDDMRLRNMAAGTRRTYVRSVADFSAFHGRSPDQLTLEDIRDYQLHLVARGLKASSICPIMSALRFLHAVTLDRLEDAARVLLPRKADPLSAILSREEVVCLLAAVADLRIRALLTAVYAAGLHVSEAVGLEVSDNLVDGRPRDPRCTPRKADHGVAASARLSCPPTGSDIWSVSLATASPQAERI